MRNARRARIGRLTVWFCLNFTIFVICYLNYRLQLKHRHLYKMLNVGLCLSRAAAMVINFNLLLVWLPMCKYSLTRLAFFATNALRRQKQLHQQLVKVTLPTISNTVDNIETDNFTCFHKLPVILNAPNEMGERSSNNANRLMSKVKSSIRQAVRQLQQWFLIVKMNFINSFLIAVDHCVSLHTICATTITIASIIHTAAHIMNVMNFSKNYDPLMSNLNMAEYKGQNPLQLLFSVPGLTGSFMIIILVLMSLSSIDIFRNSSYDLFQIFHRLSIIFVILLFLHPSSHVLKEQSNVERHHPELCYARMTITRTTKLSFNNSLLTAGEAGNSEFSSAESNSAQVAPSKSLLSLLPNATSPLLFLIQNKSNNHFQGQSYSVNTNTISDLHGGKINESTNVDENISTTDLNKFRIGSGGRQNHQIESTASTITNTSEHKLTVNNQNNNYNRQSASHSKLFTTTTNSTTNSSLESDGLCLDSQPSFVAQSSICWYVLTFGLSCYLLDLLLRKLRRSKSKIQLLDARSDGEGNLIELILSNNHKRFAQWLPGQFVYLNCPQIATYEWHPFTISSMDSKSNHFTLHIKTGGDWTKKLRQKLEPNRMDSMSTSSSSISSMLQRNQLTDREVAERLRANILRSAKLHLDLPALPDFECYNKTGHLQIQCTKVARIGAESNHWSDKGRQDEEERCVRVEIDNGYSQLNEGQSEFHSHLHNPSVESDLGLDLFIDGPFHSPFERLLEQQVSVCIASGVGWTAFSSVFQCLTNSHPSWSDTPKDCWWNQWRNFAINGQCTATLESDNTSDSSSVTYNSNTYTNTNNNNNSSNNNNNNNNNNHDIDDRDSFHQSSESKPYQISSKIRRLSNTKLHLMVIVTSIEQLRPFYKLALNYFNHIQNEYKTKLMDQLNPIREITAFITRSTKEDEAVKEFCRQENLSTTDQEEGIQVNSVFAIQFGKPIFDLYLSSFDMFYSGKISVYCCGSYQVKKTVREICQNLNRNVKNREKIFFSYHEESF